MDEATPELLQQQTIYIMTAVLTAEFDVSRCSVTRKVGK